MFLESQFNQIPILCSSVLWCRISKKGNLIFKPNSTLSISPEHSASQICLSRSFLNKWAFLKSAQKLKWQKLWRQFKLCHFNSLHLETDGMSGATLHFQVSLSLRVAFYFFLCARSAWESSCSSGNTVNGFLRALDWRLWSLWVILASDRQTIPFLLQYTQPPGYTCTTDHVVRRFYL